jgi:hypothetical protein
MSVEAKLTRILRGFDYHVYVLGKDDRVRTGYKQGSYHVDYSWNHEILASLDGHYRGKWKKVTFYFSEYADKKTRNLAIKRQQWIFNYFDLGTLTHRDSSYVRTYDKCEYILDPVSEFVIQDEQDEQSDLTSLF